MITGELKYKKESYRAIVRLEQQLQDNATQACLETAHEFVSYVRRNWSSAPSVAGDRPAVQEGTLDDGISVDSKGRDELGKYRGANSSVYFVHFDTSDAGRGQYAIAVDEGNRIFNAKPRPYIDESIEANVDVLKKNLKRKSLRGF